MSTEHTEFDPPEPLPGLEHMVPGNTTPLVRALHRTIAALDGLELLEEVHALDLEAMRLLCRSAGIKVASGRASTVANDVELMLKIKQNIVTPPEVGEGSVDSELREAMRAFSEALDGTDLDAPA